MKKYFLLSIFCYSFVIINAQNSISKFYFAPVFEISKSVQKPETIEEFLHYIPLNENGFIHDTRKRSSMGLEFGISLRKSLNISTGFFYCKNTRNSSDNYNYYDYDILIDRRDGYFYVQDTREIAIPLNLQWNILPHKSITPIIAAGLLYSLNHINNDYYEGFSYLGNLNVNSSLSYKVSSGIGFNLLSSVRLNILASLLNPKGGLSSIYAKQLGVAFQIQYFI